MASVNISIVRDNGTSISLNGPVDDALFAGIGQTVSDHMATAIAAVTATPAPAPAPVPPAADPSATAPTDPAPAPATTP